MTGINDSKVERIIVRWADGSKKGRDLVPVTELCALLDERIFDGVELLLVLVAKARVL